MTTITAEQANAITAYLATHHLPAGMGTKKEACSVAAINLVLTGKLTDTIPDCMSEVVGRWIITTQDRLDDKTRNSAEWKALLPLAAGTGRDREPERRAIALAAMWEALAWVQPIADKGGYGEAWATMLHDRTRASAYAASAYAASAYAASAASASAYAYAASAASAAYAAAAASASAAADASASAASAAAAAADAADAAAADASADAYGPWAIATLARLVA